ncbi:MAG: hypothetical protein ACOYLS_03705 [Polymorphobacter sp.]
MTDGYAAAMAAAMPSDLNFIDSQPIIMVGIGLLVLMVVAAEIGIYRRRRRPEAGETHYAAAASVSLLGLLIGFTFNVALNRYDERRDLVVEEAAAITMAWERSQLLPATAASSAGALINRYIDARRGYFQRGQVTDRQRAADLPGRAVRQQLWALARTIEASGDKPLMARAFIDALSGVDTVAAHRESMAREHIPLSVVYALGLVAIITAANLGYAGAMYGQVTRHANWAFFVLVVVALVVVIDLDRPKTGMVTVSQQPMQELEALLDAG